MPAWLCSSMASGWGQPFSTASRKRCSDPTPGLPPHEKISPLAQPAPISWSYTMSGVIRTSVRSLPALADDLVPGGVGDQVGEALERDRVAVVDELGDRVVAQSSSTDRSAARPFARHLGYHGGSCASTLIQTLLASVYSRIASKPISRP